MVACNHQFVLESPACCDWWLQATTLLLQGVLWYLLRATGNSELQQSLIVLPRGLQSLRFDAEVQLHIPRLLANPRV